MVLTVKKSAEGTHLITSAWIEGERNGALNSRWIWN